MRFDLKVVPRDYFVEVFLICGYPPLRILAKSVSGVFSGASEEKSSADFVAQLNLHSWQLLYNYDVSTIHLWGKRTDLRLKIDNQDLTKVKDYIRTCLGK